MYAAHKRARRFSRHYRSQLVAHLGINILENPAAEQSLRPISNLDAMSKVRSLKSKDNDADAEYISHPW